MEFYISVKLDSKRKLETRVRADTITAFRVYHDMCSDCFAHQHDFEVVFLKT